MLTCEDGVLNASNADCVPLPCDFNSSALAELNGTVGTFYAAEEVAHGASWTEACSDVNSVYYNDITITCNAAELRVDQSQCAGPCFTGDGVTVQLLDQNRTLELSSDMLNSEVFETNCSDVHPVYDGAFNTTCAMSILTADTSTCAQGCPVGQLVDVNVTGGSFNVALAAQVVSGSVTYVDCSSGLSSSYSGILAISCQEGNMTIDHNCSFACAAGKSTTVTLDGTDYDAIVTVELGHGLEEREPKASGLCFPKEG
eukprot:2102577-Amphidinium_carterae.1